MKTKKIYIHNNQYTRLVRIYHPYFITSNNDCHYFVAIAFMIPKIIHILFHMSHKNDSLISTSSSLLFDPYNKNWIRIFLSKMKVSSICFRMKIKLLIILEAIMIWWRNVKKTRHSNHDYIYDKKTRSQTIKQYLIVLFE